MNGSGFRRQNGVDAPRPPPLQASQGPSGRALFEGYRKDLLTNFQKESPRYNPMNPERVQSSMLVDLKDPIQVHLLTETALADSKEFEILSQEEVDDLKKQCISLTQRIEQTRANLAIQSKYRDAAISMSKLYSPTRTESKRRSLLNRHSGNAENAREAELERQLSQRKCEDLATELFNLEKRIMDPQRRLLQHTAGILQLTHRETKKKNQPQAQPPNGIPGSPESMYTYSNGRSSYEPPDHNYFDDFDEGLENWGRLRSDPIEIPMRSPNREQTKELRMETDKLREENDRLKDDGDQLRNEVDGLRQEGTQRLQTISETERRLEDLNSRLRDVIIQMNPMQNRSYASPPYGLTNGSDRAIEPGDLLGSQLEYLERGIAKVSDDQENQTSALSQDAEDRINSLSQQLRDILLSIDPNYPMPPTLTGLQTQFRYLQEGLGAIESQLARASEMSNTSSADRQKTEQVEAVLSGLWDIIQSGYADMAQRKQARRKTRLEKGISDDDSDMSGDEAFDPDEQYSLQAFSAKVQWLYSQATILKEQKSVLKRQIKQQRELNNKSDAEKDLEIQRKTEELVQTKNILVDTQKEAKDFAEQLSLALEDLESARSAQQTHATDEAAAFKATEEQLKQSASKISALESSSADLQARLEVADVNVQAITVKLEDAIAAKESVDKQLEEKAAALKSKEEELDQMNMIMVQIKTELTIAQAELDGAYGSRSERAAEAAAIASTAQAGKMQSRIEELESELKGTLEEFENMTKETMAAEKEKLDLEEKLDDALAARGSLESEVKALRERLDKEGEEMRTKIAKLQEELDTEKLKAPISGVQVGARPGVGASMLSEQFRTTMREERKRFQEDLRREVTERRKLEEELRQFKKALGPGKSPLSPR